MGGEKGTYREVTPAAIVLGVIWGAFLAASFTYAGMIMGFTSGDSAIVAIVGWGTSKDCSRGEPSSRTTSSRQ